MNKANGQILIVDDEPSVLYTLRYILERVGYTVIEASSRMEALDRLESAAVDVVICDLGLGEVSGVNVLHEARRKQPELDCILLTGYAPQQTIDELEEQGIPVFFKPIETGRLLPELRRIMERKVA